METRKSVSTGRPVVLSAVAPTSRLTLGNYLGALKQWVPMQENYDCIFFAVDMHAITVRQDPQELRHNTYLALATYLAAGIDPAQSLVFVQSHVPEHAELAWVLTCFSYMGELGRMTQFKDKSAKQGSNIGAGLFTYPVLMAADILLYRTEKVPVGADQKQHVELTRDLAQRMNAAFAREGDELFVVPEPLIAKSGARVMNLQDPTAKMSKSDPNPKGNVYILDTDDEIRAKFKRAVTDSGTEIAYSDDKPGIRNLLDIQAAITGKAPADLVAAYAGKQYGHLKVETAELAVQTLAPLRDRALEYMKDLGELDRILRAGATRARERARKTLDAVHARVGFLRR